MIERGGTGESKSRQADSQTGDKAGLEVGSSGWRTSAGRVHDKLTKATVTSTLTLGSRIGALMAAVLIMSDTKSSGGAAVAADTRTAGDTMVFSETVHCLSSL